MSPLQRTLDFLRGIDAIPVKLEYFNKWAKRRIDIWGADVLALHGSLLMAIQCTDGAHQAQHITKAIANPDVRNWLKGNAAFYIYAWKQPTATRRRWRLQITQLVFDGDNNLTTLTHGSEILDT
jgi:hypothetical protein